MRQDAEALLTPPNSLDIKKAGATLSFAVLTALIVWLLGWYWETAVSIQASWSRSETYQHGYLIVPISAWLIWRRREYLKHISPAPAFLPLLALVLFGAAWLLADLAEVVVVRQYALVLMVPAIVAAVMGYRFAWAMAFPLVFLVFAVPFGDFLIPPMMNFTADFTVGALQLTGIPVFREGTHFSLPSGEWSVVEACSGLRYLVSAITLGCLYAYLTYRRWSYRLVFITLSVLVPILANGVRAYFIVMLGHLSSMRLAVGVDHLIYGWVFFGIVIMLLFWIGSFWREDTDPTPEECVAVKNAATPSLEKLLTVTLLSAAFIAVWSSYADRLDANGKMPSINLQTPDVAGWRRVDQPISTWRPHYLTARARVHQTFEKDGHAVGLFIGYYNHQTEDAKLISSLNALTVTEDKSWVTVGTRSATIERDSVIHVRESLLRGAGVRLTAWDWFWIAGQHTDNPYIAKLTQAKSRLFGHGDDSAIIVLYTLSGDRDDSAKTYLRDFARDALPAIERSLNAAAGN